MYSILLNGLSILTGTLIGTLFGKKLSKDFKDLLNYVIGLSALTVGISTLVEGVTKSNFSIVYIVFLLIGAIIGQGFRIHQRVEKCLESLSKNYKSNGLITGISLLCVGTLPILGPLQIVLQNTHAFMNVNIIFSFIVALTLSSTNGTIIMLVAPILLTMEMIVFIFSGTISSFIIPTVLNEMVLIGGILALATGLNILELTKIPVLNLLPALFLPILLKFL